MRVLLNSTKDDVDHLARMLKTLKVQQVNRSKRQANADFKKSFK